MGPFSRTVTINFVSKSQHSLRNSKGFNLVLSLFLTLTHTPLFSNFLSKKRVLSDISFLSKKEYSHFSVKGKMRASMTVEASLVLPIFMFCFMNVLFSFRMIETQSRLLAAVHQVGNSICFYGYGEKYLPNGVPEGLSSIILSEGYARGAVINKVGSSFFSRSSVKGGAAGISFLGSEVMKDNDLVDIRLSWLVKPFAASQGFRPFFMGCRYYGRAWTGYDVTRNFSDMEAEDPMVYITEHGSVYHVYRDCRYLNPTILMVSAANRDTLRNNDGAKYYVCHYCGENSIQAVYYVTPEGNRYHSNPNCSGLKRTIYTVPLSEVGGRGPCSVCGG